MKTLSFTEIWNGSLITEEREMKPRDYCWASELYKPLVDRYLAMRGVAPTNPPNTRSYRKFWAGNVWEFVAGLVLWQLGIIQEKQQEVWVEDAPLRVKGKLDYLIGGTPDYSRARDAIKAMPFQREITARFMKAIDRFEERLGVTELTPLVFEIKSCAEYLIDKLDAGGFVLGHDQQLYHYLRGLNMPEGHICYISKNDALMFERVIEMDVHGPSLKEIYESDLKELAAYLKAEEQPPPAPLIVVENGKFQKNFGVEYSSYLTMVYGFDRPDQYAEAVASQIRSWNNVIDRIQKITKGVTIKKGKKEVPMELTDDNKKKIDEIHRAGWDAYEMAKQK